MRIACMIRLPGGRNGGKRIGDLVANIDIMPSLLTYMGLPLPDGMDGDIIDLDAAIVPFAPRPSFGEATKPPDKIIETDPRWTNILKARCIRDGKYKYIHVPYPRDLGIPLPREALFDLEADPNERVNLLESPTAEIDSILNRLKSKLERWAVSGHPLETQYDPSQRDETTQRLGAMGYVEYGGERMSFQDAQRAEGEKMQKRMEALGYIEALRNIPVRSPRRPPRP